MLSFFSFKSFPFSKTLDVFLSKKMRQVDVEQLGVHRIYMFAQIAIGFLLFFSAFIYQFGYYYNTTHLLVNWGMWLVHTLLIVFHRFVPSMQAGTMISATNMLIGTAWNAFYSGGLFANDLFFLQEIFLVVFLMVNKKLGFLFSALSFLVLFGFMGLHLSTNINFRELDNAIPIDNDFGNHFIFFLAGLIMVSTFSSGHKKLKEKIANLQKIQVDELNFIVESKTKELADKNQKLHKLRTEIARDFHDEVGNQIASLNMICSRIQFESESQAFKADSQIMQLVNKLSNTSKGIHQQSRDFLWSIGQPSQMASDIFAYIRDFCAAECESSGIAFTVDQQYTSDKELDPSQARQIVLIFKEAMLNSIRHSQSNQVKLFFRYQKEKISFRLTDDGIGIKDLETLKNKPFDPNQQEGLGVPGMFFRAKRMNVSFEIKSGSSQGTEVSLEAHIG